MPVSNFSQLLNDALKGDNTALIKWLEHTEEASFDETEIEQATKEINGCLIQGGAQKSFAFYLKGLWHQYGIGTKKNYSEAIKLYEQAVVAVVLDNIDPLDNEAYRNMAVLITNSYLERIKTFAVDFSEASITPVRKQQEALLQQLADITFNKPGLSQALKILKIQDLTPVSTNLSTIKLSEKISYPISNAIARKQKEINSRAQELQKTIEEAQRQLAVEERKKDAQRTVAFYMGQIKTFPINFNSPQTIDQVQAQQKELIDNLHRITHDKGKLRTNLLTALGILKISIAHVDNALDEKKNEVISAAQTGTAD